jgi:hypothetical protein
MRRGARLLDRRSAALFAADCAERVLPIFEAAYPTDDRPRKAIEAARSCASVAAARAAAFAAHAAARAATDASAAYAARAAGHAAATLHAAAHAVHAAAYAERAVAARTSTRASLDGEDASPVLIAPGPKN